MRRKALFGFGLGVGTLAACGGDSGGAPIVSVADATAMLPGDAGGCTPVACTCGTQAGMQYCVDGGLAACECAPMVMLPPLETDTSGDCPDGIYLGNFDGAAGFIVPTTPVSGVDFSGMPPLEITLSKPEGGSEFAVVGNGLMHGNADGVFPFEAMIMGELDCSTKRFTATLTGSVQLFVDGVRNNFTGTMVSNYDGATHQFVDGVWTVTGSNVDGGVDFGLTGNGKWSADSAPNGYDGGVPDGGASDAAAADAGP